MVRDLDGALDELVAHELIAALAGDEQAREAIRTQGPGPEAIRTARRYRTIEIQAGSHTITAADPLRRPAARPSTVSTSAQVRTNVSRVRYKAREDPRRAQAQSSPKTGCTSMRTTTSSPTTEPPDALAASVA
jgi:hypothetical protein